MVNKQTQFYLSPEGWELIINDYLDLKYRHLPTNNRAYLNKDIYSRYFPDNFIELEKYYIKNNDTINYLCEKIDTDRHLRQKNSDNIILKNRTIVQEFSSIISKINLYDNPNKLLYFLGLDLYNYSNQIPHFKLFKTLEKNGLNVENFFSNYIEIKKKQVDVYDVVDLGLFNNLWIKWHHEKHIQPNLEQGLFLIKNEDKNSSKKLDLTNIQRKIEKINKLPKSRESFDYIISLLDKNDAASAKKEIQKSLQKYDENWYEKESYRFEKTKNNFIAINDYQVVEFQVKRTDLVFSGVMKAMESVNFINNLSECMGLSVKKNIPDIKIYPVNKDNKIDKGQLHFFCHNIKEKEQLTVFLNKISETLESLILNDSKSSTMDNKRQAISESLATIWLETKISDLLEIKDEKSQQPKKSQRMKI